MESGDVYRRIEQRFWRPRRPSCALPRWARIPGNPSVPATWCGLVGVRPSWGLVSRYGVMRGVWSMDTVGPISRTVEDAAITLGAIAGHDPKDPSTWRTPVPDYRQALGTNLQGLTIGVITGSCTVSW